MSTPSDPVASAAPKHRPVTDDIVWCGTCENYHLPNQHDEPDEPPFRFGGVR